MEEREETLAERTQRAIDETPRGFGLRVVGFVLFIGGLWLLGSGNSVGLGVSGMIVGAIVWTRGREGAS